MLTRIMGNRTSEQWVAEYAQGHTNSVNQACHAVGIPMIAASVPLFVVALFAGGFWRVPVALFTVGWGFQFVGHAFEGKPPEFVKDPRFLFVGLRWWVAKRLGRL
jgi:uncharacterized membrane protein YGL010W